MAKHDNRKNNVERLKQMKDNTLGHIEAAEEALANTEMTDQEKQATIEKNERRKESVAAMEQEIDDEMNARRQGNID